MTGISTYTLPCDLDCDPAGCRGRLEHSLLKNMYLALSAKKLHQRLSQSVSEGNTLVNRTRQEFETLLRTLEHGYSPARLVKRLQPLASLSHLQQQDIETKLHAWFYAEFRPDEKQSLLEERGGHFFTAAEHFSRCGDPDSTEGKAAYAEFVKAIQKLRTVLDKLPKGIWCFQ